ncbi:MAG TPA: radical SAM protein [Candidatus Hydrogenedentes bacterium]|nr:radical SAM protein [Candidatus Hydrogenedentota bacterium]HRT21014.1 radical SAM protein [Candidatus Hydrogenedentota bacterium]HRT65843.1 radical SAM protein [Candidatus Hydrogenedentota bacterium]
MKQLRVFLTCLGRNSIYFPGTTPPLGILYLAAYLRKCFDVEIRLLDQRAENCSLQEVARRAIEFEADVVGIGTFTLYADTLPSLTTAIRQGLPNSLIVLGGPHVSSFGATALENTAADAGVRGEGERPFEAIVSAWLAGSDFSHIPGLFWRDASGAIISNPGSMPVIEDLDSLPFPAYDLLDVSQYWRDFSFGNLPPHRYVSMFSSRGCPRLCTYCHSIFGKRFRAHSAERIVEELKHYVRTYGITEVEFLDDTFNHDAKRAIQFADLMRKEGVKIKLGAPNGLQSHTLTEEVLDALVETGLHQASFALESGSPRIQELIKKHLSIPKFIWCVEQAIKRRVLANGNTIMGFPTETEEDLKATVDVVCQSKLHTVSFFTVVPYPNTELYEQLKELQPEKLAKVRYWEKDFSVQPVNFSAVPDSVLFAIQRKAWRRFYLNPLRLARIARDYPDPWFLARLLPMFMRRVVKGIGVEE